MTADCSYRSLTKVTFAGVTYKFEIGPVHIALFLRVSIFAESKLPVHIALFLSVHIDPPDNKNAANISVLCVHITGSPLKK